MSSSYTGVPKTPSPEMWAKLGAAIPSLGVNDKAFALSLYDGHTKYGGWSEKQALWAQKMVEKVNANEPAAKTSAAPISEPVAGPLKSLFSLFEIASVHLKKPFIVLSLPAYSNKVVVLKKSPSQQHINVVSGGSYPNAYYGKVSAGGVWMPGYGTYQSFTNAIEEALLAFANDPAGEAAKYGKLKGKCSFCNKGLTDAKSTEVGYGPVCAGHYGLPWGNSPFTVHKSKPKKHNTSSNAPIFNTPIFKPNTIKPSGAGVDVLSEVMEMAQLLAGRGVPQFSVEALVKEESKPEYLF